MGSWNGTCAVSNLPICYGDPVVMILIAQSSLWNPDKTNDSNSYANSFWEPVGFPMRARYNDYGWIENIQEDVFSEWNLQWIRDNLIERDMGKNKYHDHAVKRDQIDWDQLDDIFHGDRLWLKMNSVISMGRSHRSGNFILIHERIYDMLSTKTRYNFEEHDISVLQNDLREDIATTLKEKKLWNALLSSEIDDDNLELVTLVSPTPSNYNLISKYRSISNLFDFLDKNPEEIDEFVKRASHFYIFDLAITKLRKHYNPMTGAGSQSTYHDLHGMLAKEIVAICKQYDFEPEHPSSNIRLYSWLKKFLTF